LRETIYHLVTESEFQTQAKGDTYLPTRFDQDGFIHCTGEPGTLLAVANDYFSGVEEPVLVLVIDTAKLAAEVRFEPPAPVAGSGVSHLGKARLFPHIYGPLNLDAVTGIGVLQPHVDGYVWPDRFLTPDSFHERERASCMDDVKQHFEQEAREYDGIILKLIPHYPQMLDALVSAIPFDASKPIRVIDLGCGTGTISQRMLAAYPNARVTCLDLAENMVAIARAKLGQRVRCLVGDFNAFAFDAQYDAIVSSLALHHLATDADKLGFYRQIYDALAPGGVFFNADVVLGSSGALQATYMRKWRAFMQQNVSDEEIAHTWLPKYYAEDRPAKLTNHLAWLAEVGFADVDVVWKHYNYAVYGGTRA
jgi:tRNA (cmo5U34)-methyltransferase